MAPIDRRFCIDRWEASVVEVGAGGDVPFSPFLLVEGHDVRAVSAPGVFPQGYVSGAQALSALRAPRRKLALCSPMGWPEDMQCVGPGKTRLYGYSAARERGRCNDTGRSPMLAVWGPGALSSASDWDPLKMNDPRLNQLDGSLARTGAHPDCTNEYGVFEHGRGNLARWTRRPRRHVPVKGYYLDTTLNGEGCALPGRRRTTFLPRLLDDGFTLLRQARADAPSTARQLPRSCRSWRRVLGPLASPWPPGRRRLGDDWRKVAKEDGLRFGQDGVRLGAPADAEDQRRRDDLDDHRGQA